MTEWADSMIVAPYVGEFGWELMNWQARVRRIVGERRPQRVFICTHGDRNLLYADLRAPEVRFVATPGLAVPGEPNDDHRVDETGRTTITDAVREAIRRQSFAAVGEAFGECAGADYLAPDYRSTIWPTTAAYQTFVRMRRTTPVVTDVVLVPRRRRSAPDRNQPDSWWRALADALASRGLSVETYGQDLDAAVTQLSRARLAVGASTGGLHLASLCACPHYVWGCGPERRWTPLAVTNRQRYETVWNPFGTPCRYDECGWSPSIDHVVEQSVRALREIGRIRRAPAARLAFAAKWRVKRRLARLLEPSRAAGPIPWRVRRWVRERVV